MILFFDTGVTKCKRHSSMLKELKTTLPYPSLPYPILPSLPYPILPYPTLAKTSGCHTTVQEGQQEVPPSKSTLKFYVNDKDVWVCSTTVGQRVCGTITERTSPSLYKVNNQTWRRLVKKLQDSYLAPPRKETNDCFVPEIGKYVMPVVPETEQKEAPNSVLKSQPKPSPESKLNTTHHPPTSFNATCQIAGLYLRFRRTLFVRLLDFVRKPENFILFHFHLVLCVFCKFTF